MDALLTLMDLSFRAATFELQSGSLQAFLASGDLSEVPDNELKGILAAWPAEVSRLRNQSVEDTMEIVLWLENRASDIVELTDGALNE